MPTLLKLLSAILFTATAFIWYSFFKAQATPDCKTPTVLDWLLFLAIMLVPPSLGVACIVVANKL